jgi:hypothetical protein
MSIHKLTAGSGYDYLTRQVAALDATEKGHVPLASYYTERGETPGVWIGSGLAGIDGLQAGDSVTAEQMQALFGVGLHPLAVQRQQQLQGPDLTSRDYLAVTRLGAPFKIYHNDIPPFRVEVARWIVGSRRPTARLANSTGRTCTCAHRGGDRILHRRAWQATAGCAGTRRRDRETLRPPNDRGRRLRPHLLPSQKRLDAIEARRSVLAADFQSTHGRPPTPVESLQLAQQAREG